MGDDDLFGLANKSGKPNKSGEEVAMDAGDIRTRGSVKVLAAKVRTQQRRAHGAHDECPSILRPAEAS